MKVADSFFEPGGAGEFVLTNLSLFVRNDFPAGGFESIRAKGDEEARMEAWFAATVYFHEMRHFHDLIGTPSGLGLFLETTRLIDDLLRLLEQAGDNPVPVSRRAPDGKAARLYGVRRDYLAALLGNQTRPITTEEAEDREFKVQDYRFDGLGIHFYMPLVPIPRHDPRTGTLVEDQVPLGLRALVEHTATEIQCFFATTAAGEDPHATGNQPDRHERYFRLLQTIAGANGAAYYLVHRLAHYHLMGKPGQPMPGLGSLMALTLAALDIGGYAQVAGQGWVYEHPGQGFVQLLAQWQGGHASFEADVDEVDGFVAQVLGGQSWRNFLALHVRRMELDPSAVVPEHLRPQAAKNPLIADIRRIALRDHLEIMRSKSVDLIPWVNPVRYVQSLGTLPQPPLTVRPDSVAISSGADGAYFLTWSLLLQLVEGIMNGSKLECMVARTRSPLMDKFSFADPDAPGKSTTCHRFVERRCCGEFNGRFLDGQPPECPFGRVAASWSDALHLRFT